MLYNANLPKTPEKLVQANIQLNLRERFFLSLAGRNTRTPPFYSPPLYRSNQKYPNQSTTKLSTVLQVYKQSLGVSMANVKKKDSGKNYHLVEMVITTAAVVVMLINPLAGKALLTKLKVLLN